MNERAKPGKQARAPRGRGAPRAFREAAALHAEGLPLPTPENRPNVSDAASAAERSAAEPSAAEPSTAELGQAQSARPERRCVGCNESAPQPELLRFALDPVAREPIFLGLVEAIPTKSAAKAEFAAGGMGRSVYVHPVASCLRRAFQSGFARGFKGEVRVDVPALLTTMADVLSRRVIGLLSSAMRLRRVAVGADAARDAMAANPSCLTLVACDAGSILEDSRVQYAIGEGNCLAFADKYALAAPFGRESVAIVTLTHAGIAHAIRSVLATLAAVHSLQSTPSPAPKKSGTGPNDPSGSSAGSPSGSLGGGGNRPGRAHSGQRSFAALGRHTRHAGRVHNALSNGVHSNDAHCYPLVAILVRNEASTGLSVDSFVFTTRSRQRGGQVGGEACRYPEVR